MMVEAEEDEAAGFGDALRPTTPVPQAATDYVQLETQKTDGRTRTASTLRTVGASLPTPRQSESDAQSSIDEGGIIVDDVGATESLNVEDFSRWVTCLCVVAFDIELGQAMEYMYPPGRLSDAETAAVCYLSFPDSNAGMVGDSVFSFRVKAGAENHPHSRGSLASSSSPVLSGNEAGALAVPASSVSMGSNGGSPSTRPSTASVSSATSAPSLQSTLSKAMMNTPSPVQGDVYYGYVFFRQVRDANLKRGYFQKSLVLLSPHPFVGLFSRIVRLIAPEFFDNGRPLLEAACRNISRWPSPAPGNTFELPILGHVLQVRVPAPHEKADFWNDSIDERDGVVGGQRRIHASLLEIDAFSCFRGVIGELYALWELVLTAEPLIVMAATPTCCSDTVLALISLISPLSYSCDYRPYFTIHDSDFKEFTSKTKPAPHAILGVTNPFFTKAFQHWPHMLKVGAAPKSSSPLSPNGDAGLVRRRRSDWKPILASDYRPFLDRDKVFLKRLISMPNRNPDGSVASVGVASPQNVSLRRHFAELTNAFMAPLERYFSSLMPLQKKVMAWRNPPRLKSFNKDEFLRAVEAHGPHVTGGRKGDWVGLYRKFIASPNFIVWYRARQSEANDRLRSIYLELLCQADVGTWMRGKAEIEVVDLLLRLREELTNPKSRRVMTPKMADALGGHIDTIVSNLPEDLRNSLQVTM